MRRRRFEPKERTKSFVFLPPMLNIDPQICQIHLLINAYLANDEFPEAENTVYLHYEYQDIDGSFARLENNFRSSPYFKYMYDPDKYTSMFIFNIPEEWLPDYNIFLASKYSRISEACKKRILNFGAYGMKSQVYETLYRSEARRKLLEEKLGVDLPINAEVASAIDLSLETYTKNHIIKNPNLLNPLIWE